MHLQRLVSEVWAKYKDVPTKILNVCKIKLKLTKLKDIGLKGTDKLAKERWMCGNSNSKFDAECYSKSYNVNDAKSLQILYQDCSINLHLEAANHVYWLI